MAKHILLFLCISIGNTVFGLQPERLTLGLFWNERPQTIIISVRGGEYKLIGDGKTEIPFGTHDMFQLSTDGTKVKVKNLAETFGSFSKIEVIEVVDTSSINIKSSKPKLANRVYEDDFTITSSQNRLKILNNAQLANYVAGVVQWESGIGRTPEYYKVQAIITRTYALKNINKYHEDGFNLCDRVDSQVYKGRSKNRRILQAVKETHDLVIVDHDMNLISAVFHSNSGGKTYNSEDVWSQPLPYLKAVPDQYSVDQPHYNWQKTIAIEKWLTTFQKKYNVDINNPETRAYLLNYCPVNRKHYFLPNDTLKTTTVRSQFRLRSTDFCVEKNGSNLVITGKGFGHGVGLSQEGAMKMAQMGKSYKEILTYYYKDVHVVHLSTMDYLESN